MSNGCRGYKRFFRRAHLEASDYLKNDMLAITCTVGVVFSATQGPKPISIAVPDSDIGAHFGQLLDSREGTDVSFVVDEEVFPAHKLVLAARSPVFKAQLFGPLRERGGTGQPLVLEDIRAPVFKVRQASCITCSHVMLFHVTPCLVMPCHVT